jgi:hypothetical protein
VIGEVDGDGDMVVRMAAQQGAQVAFAPPDRISRRRGGIQGKLTTSPSPSVAVAVHVADHDHDHVGLNINVNDLTNHEASGLSGLRIRIPRPWPTAAGLSCP